MQNEERGFRIGENLCQLHLAVKRHNDHRNLQKKAFNLGLAYSYRGVIHDHLGRKYGSRQAYVVLEQQVKDTP